MIDGPFNLFYNATKPPATNYQGHDVSNNGKIYKLDWSNNKDGLWALIEYLKTLQALVTAMF